MQRKRFALGVGSAVWLMILLIPGAFAQAPVREVTQINIEGMYRHIQLHRLPNP